MPTYNDETLHDRYAREHADHQARLAKLTPEQIAEMELDLHNALAEADRLRAQVSQGGEAVAWRVTGRDGLTVTSQYPEWAEADCLLTITPLYTHPADQAAKGVVVQEMEWLEQWLLLAAEPIGQECCGRAHLECCGNSEPVYRTADEIAAAMNARREELRALLANSEGVKK